MVAVVVLMSALFVCALDEGVGCAMLIHKLTALLTCVKGERDARGGGEGGAHRQGERLAVVLMHCGAEGEQEARHRAPKQALSGLLVLVNVIMAHHPLRDLLILLSGLHRGEGTKGKEGLHHGRDQPCATGEPAPPPRERDRAAEEGHDHREGEGEVNKEGV